MPPDSPELGVVVGLDGSAASRIALGWAAHAAHEREASITAVLVLPRQTGTTKKTWRLTHRLMTYGVKELPHRRVGRIIDDATEIVSASGDHPPKVKVRVFNGDALSTLTDLASDAQLVVVGAPRRSWCPTAHRSLGAKLRVQAHCPVEVVTDASSDAPEPVGASG